MGYNLNNNSNYFEICRDCGTKNDGNELFCGNCGNQLEKSVKSIEPEIVPSYDKKTETYTVKQKQTEIYPSQPKQTTVYPTSGNNLDTGLHTFSKYPVSWDEGVAIVLGGVLLTYGLGVVVFFFLLNAQIRFEFEFLLFFGALPIVVGYLFLRSYMNFLDMIKLAFGAAAAIVFILIIIFLLVVSIF